VGTPEYKESKRSWMQHIASPSPDDLAPMGLCFAQATPCFLHSALQKRRITPRGAKIPSLKINRGCS